MRYPVSSSPPVGVVAVALLLVAGLVSVVACSTEERGFQEGNTAFVTDAGAEGGCAIRRCSRDLHQVLEGCTDTVLLQCPAGTGCAEGSCVTPCESAAASRGSIGCTFWTTPSDVLAEARGGCFAAFVANTWDTPAHVTASFGAAPLDVSKSIYRAVNGADRAVSYQPIDGAVPPGEVGIVFLADGPDGVRCPTGVVPARTGVVVSGRGTSLSSGFQISVDVPVSAYSIFPYGGAKSFTPSATMLLPVPSWGTNYLLVDAFPSKELGTFVQIVAQTDNTEVRIRPKVDVSAGTGVHGAARGVTGSWMLNRGEVLELEQLDSLAGSPVETNHPVGLFGGTRCAYIPADKPACDSMQQQIPPLSQWSATYSAVPYRSRRVSAESGRPAPSESVPYGILGAIDGTVLTYRPKRPEGAPTKLSSGEYVFFDADAPFSVTTQDSNHPLYLGVYMTGQENYGTLGDPDFVNIVPDDQFLDRYVFFVDHTYADSTLTVVRRKDQAGFHDVVVDCVGKVGGWQALGDEGTIEYAWLDVTKGGQGVTTGAGTCNYGRHEASSDGGSFGLYVWGVDSYASYGYPAGAGSRPSSEAHIDVR